MCKVYDILQTQGLPLSPVIYCCVFNPASSTSNLNPRSAFTLTNLPEARDGKTGFGQVKIMKEFE